MAGQRPRTEHSGAVPAIGPDAIRSRPLHMLEQKGSSPARRQGPSGSRPEGRTLGSARRRRSMTLRRTTPHRPDTIGRQGGRPIRTRIPTGRVARAHSPRRRPSRSGLWPIAACPSRSGGARYPSPRGDQRRRRSRRGVDFDVAGGESSGSWAPMARKTDRGDPRGPARPRRCEVTSWGRT